CAAEYMLPLRKHENFWRSRSIRVDEANATQMGNRLQPYTLSVHSSPLYPPRSAQTGLTSKLDALADVFPRILSESLGSSPSRADGVVDGSPKALQVWIKK